MITKFLLLSSLALSIVGCSDPSDKSQPTVTTEYARLTRIQGNGDQFGTRYFWESRTTKTEAMNYKGLHEYFKIALPKEGELTVIPFDYKVIDHICASGWNLVSANSSSGFVEDSTKYNPVQVYHFTK